MQELLDDEDEREAKKYARLAQRHQQADDQILQMTKTPNSPL